MAVNNEKVKKQLKIGIFLSYISIAINILSGVILVPFIIRIIGKTDYGLYSAASSLVTMFLLDLGLSSAVTKFVSKYRVISTQEEIDKLLRVISMTFLFLAAIIALIFFVLFFFLGQLYSSFTTEELESFRIVFIIVACYSAFSFPFKIFDGILLSYDKMYLSNIADIISKLIFIVATIIVLVFNLGLLWLTSCFAIHGIIGVVLKFIFAKCFTPVKLLTKISMVEFKETFKQVVSFSLWSAISSFGRYVMVAAIPTILGFTSKQGQGSNEIAVFAVASQIESYVSLFATTFGSIFFPSVSRILFKDGIVNDKSLELFSEFHKKIARVQSIILIIIITGLCLFGLEFIGLWAGEGYDNSYLCIIFLCVPALFFYPNQMAENATAIVEKVKYLAISTLISLILGLGLAIGLSYVYGAIGASIGVCFGFIVRTILFNIVFKKTLKASRLAFYKEIYLSFVIPTIITVGVGILLNFVFASHGQSWLFFIIKVVITSLVYITSIILFGLRKYEKEQLFGLLKNKLTKKNKNNECEEQQ